MPNNNKTKILKKLANLQLAIGLLITIGFLIAIGTIIEQDQSLNFYKENYPEANPLFGFLDWKVITFLSFDKLYTAWWFIFLLLVFGGSLLACTFTTQLPSVKTFKIWKFITQLSQYKNLKINDEIKFKVSNTLAFNCNETQYHFFRQRKKSYAYSGLLGRVAPIIVHISIIVLLLGSTLGSFLGYTAQEIVPRGEIFHIQNLTKSGNTSYIPQNFSCRINNFWITYTKDLKTDQFYSDLSLFDQLGNEVKRKIIFVNEPLIFKKLVLYQTDWDIVGLKLSLDNKKKYFKYR
jgi:cytochrome c biogenesis protein